MKFPWFRRAGIFFIPASAAGWILFLAGLGYAIYSFSEIDSKSHSVSDTLMNFVFRLLLIGAVYALIAFLTSRAMQKKS